MPTKFVDQNESLPLLLIRLHGIKTMQKLSTVHGIELNGECKGKKRGAHTQYGIIIIIRAANLKSTGRRDAPGKVAVNNCQNYLRMLCSESLPAGLRRAIQERRSKERKWVEKSSTKTMTATTKAAAVAAAAATAMHATAIVRCC